ncbi:hypothetical protein KC730_00645, partial [Candidatus Kaiserbacteria bacterium]|nr:hypothetical protein [Candidatus Kaiserbacteria bacterium]
LSRYMHKLSNAYSQYFNKRYEKSGHVFQGAYKVKLVESDEQLTYLSAYIHRNPNELRRWKNNTISYPWSSYQDYLSNRWKKLLVGEVITSTFGSFEEYQEFVENSGAKEDFEI